MLCCCAHDIGLRYYNNNIQNGPSRLDHTRHMSYGHMTRPTHNVFLELAVWGKNTHYSRVLCVLSSSLGWTLLLIPMIFEGTGLVMLLVRVCGVLHFFTTSHGNCWFHHCCRWWQYCTWFCCILLVLLFISALFALFCSKLCLLLISPADDGRQEAHQQLWTTQYHNTWDNCTLMRNLMEAIKQGKLLGRWSPAPFLSRSTIITSTWLSVAALVLPLAQQKPSIPSTLVPEQLMLQLPAPTSIVDVAFVQTHTSSITSCCIIILEVVSSVCWNRSRIDNMWCQQNSDGFFKRRFSTVLWQEQHNDSFFDAILTVVLINTQAVCKFPMEAYNWNVLKQHSWQLPVLSFHASYVLVLILEVVFPSSDYCLIAAFYCCQNIQKSIIPSTRCRIMSSNWWVCLIRGSKIVMSHFCHHTSYHWGSMHFYACWKTMKHILENKSHW